MKRKINIDRSPVSSDEISKRKDFNSLMKAGAGAGKIPVFRQKWFLPGVAVVTVAVITGAVMFFAGGTKADSNDQQLTTQQPVDSTALAAFYKAEEAKPCIAPPVEGLDIPFGNYTVIAEQGATIDVPGGGKLVVPKLAFSTADGKTVKGKVDIRYREFHDVVDCFVAGIPMTYDSAGTRYHFETAGMMEIMAYQDGQPLKVADGKKIDVEIVSADPSPKYNLYKLDTLNNNWACLGKDKIKPIQTDEASRKETKSGTDTTMSPVTVINNRIASVEKEKVQKIEALPAVKIAEPKKPAAVDATRYSFDFSFDVKEFPELKTYNNMVWEVASTQPFNKSDFDQVNNTSWEDASISEGPKKGDNYMISLRRGSKKKEFVAVPKFEGKNLEQAQKEYQKKFAEYSAAISERKKKEEALEQEYRAKLASLQAEQKRIEREWAQKEKDRFKSLSTQEQVRRTFAVNQFGVYNCDNPLAYPQGRKCVLALKDEKKKELEVYDVYLVEKGRNALFTYAKNPLQLSFDPTKENMLWTVQHGKLYLLRADAFAALNGSQSVKMELADRQFASVDELKEFLQLN
jgi:hypothetical protein